MSERVLVIVESPTKARTIKRFLPSNYHVEASVGHVRDLPQSASDVPKNLKQEDWARLGIDVENDFAPLYILPKGKNKVIRELKSKLKNSDAVVLATDEDREGESISWHLVEILKPKVPVRRMVFHEITKNAIHEALENYRDVDMSLVKAQETRRILDRLYGFTLSPLIWKKIAYGLSAGRVQSPGLRLLVERERERIRFRKSVYWDLKAGLSSPSDSAGAVFEAKLQSIEGKRIAGSKDFDAGTGELAKKNVRVLSKEEAEELSERLGNATWTVREITEKETTARPAPPFITSSLQQEANRKLGLSARDSMRIAQRLYEEGLITYMRTDSPHLSGEAIGGARRTVEERYGADYLFEKPRQFSSKARAQEAHEAIRPAGAAFKAPEQTGLTGKDRALYDMIWKRTLATQMADAKKLQVSARIEAGECEFTASGTRILFPGFLRVYVEGKDDPDAALDDKEVLLPDLTEGQTLELNNLEALYHETKPPARFTEASLVQRLEREGIGRPSTYASIISTLYERGYVRRQGTALVPTFTGFAVTQLLERHFHYLIEYGFTSEMENALDEIAYGERNSLEYLREFYLGEDGLKEQVDHREGAIDPSESRTVALPQLPEDTEIRVGRYGPYLVHQNDDEEAVHASIPEEVAPADLDQQEIEELIELSKRGPEPIGTDPETGLDVYCLVGRYGPYVQLGEKTEDGEKPKRASLPKGMKPRDVDLDTALQLLSLPRTLGVHPETGKEVVANNGRFGPFVVHDGDYRSLKKDDDVYTVDLSRALELLKEEKKGRGGVKVLRDLGKHPETNKKLAVYDGKYGPYIKHGTKNISLPDDRKDKDAIEKMTLEDALALVEASPKAGGKSKSGGSGSGGKSKSRSGSKSKNSKSKNSQSKK
ncbi:MAG: type I DNA topoisomerase [Spirochaetes bacterium]|jgi:DNA topoisomerase-1|nr:type I DNA topoisomerase [Spirochaetota bacterium]